MIVFKFVYSAELSLRMSVSIIQKKKWRIVIIATKNIIYNNTFVLANK